MKLTTPTAVTGKKAGQKNNSDMTWTEKHEPNNQWEAHDRVTEGAKETHDKNRNITMGKRHKNMDIKQNHDQLWYTICWSDAVTIYEAAYWTTVKQTACDK